MCDGAKFGLIAEQLIGLISLSADPMVGQRASVLGVGDRVHFGMPQALPRKHTHVPEHLIFRV